MRVRVRVRMRVRVRVRGHRVEHTIEDVTKELHLHDLVVTLPPAFLIKARSHQDLSMPRNDGVKPSSAVGEVLVKRLQTDGATVGGGGCLRTAMVHGDESIADLHGKASEVPSAALALRRGLSLGAALKSPAVQLALACMATHLVVADDHDDRACVVALELPPEAEAPSVLQFFFNPIRGVLAKVLVHVVDEVGTLGARARVRTRCEREARGRGTNARHEVKGQARGTRGEREARGQG